MRNSKKKIFPLEKKRKIIIFSFSWFQNERSELELELECKYGNESFLIDGERHEMNILNLIKTFFWICNLCLSVCLFLSFYPQLSVCFFLSALVCLFLSFFRLSICLSASFAIFFLILIQRKLFSRHFCFIILAFLLNVTYWSRNKCGSSGTRIIIFKCHRKE